MTSEIKLHSGPPSSASILGRIFSPISPLMIVIILLSKGLPAATWTQIRSLNPIHWLNPFRWRDLILTFGMGPLLEQSDQGWRSVKQDLIGQNAQGRILEVGAGTGLTTAYYDEEKVKELVCLEPFAPLREELKTKVSSRGKGFSSKTIILPYGIEERSSLESHKVTQESFDTIVLVQVLCSIPNPRSHLSYLQSLLKPGGRLLLFEHVKSQSSLTGLLQDLWTPGWKFMAKGCCLNRNSLLWFKEIGGWKETNILVPENESLATMVPHQIGIFVKA